MVKLSRLSTPRIRDKITPFEQLFTWKYLKIKRFVKTQICFRSVPSFPPPKKPLPFFDTPRCMVLNTMDYLNTRFSYPNWSREDSKGKRKGKSGDILPYPRFDETLHTFVSKDRETKGFSPGRDSARGVWFFLRDLFVTVHIVAVPPRGGTLMPATAVAPARHTAVAVWARHGSASGREHARHRICDLSLDVASWQTRWRARKRDRIKYQLQRTYLRVIFYLAQAFWYYEMRHKLFARFLQIS